MGQIVSRFKEPLQYVRGSVAEVIAGNRKRKRSQSSDTSSNELGDSDLLTPKKKKLLTTTQYIYKTLFKEQKSSDITVMALGKIWHLHKVYLCQSPYFYSMFNGSWKESGQDFIHIKILDSKITLDALEAVFGSLYSDEIEVDPQAVVSVLATATLFQLEGIINRCVEVMIETTNAETAILHYEAACLYGTQTVKKSAFEWLETNLLCLYIKHVKYLKLINTELMTALVSSSDLYVIQTEFSLYILLRKWMFSKLFPDYDPEEDKLKSPNDLLNKTPQTYFANLIDKPPFLYTSDGMQFEKAFRALRIQHLINHHMDLKVILEDKIIPKEWLNSHILSHWNSIIKIDHTSEEGPQQVNNEDFLKYCMRCGRTLLEPGYQKWRWTGFNFGLDLILIADQRVLSIKRHHRNEHERLLSLKNKRQFMIRVSVTSLNSQRQRKFVQSLDIKSLCLEKNEEVSLMIMDSKLVHPLLISVNWLLVCPEIQSICNEKQTVEESNPVAISEIGTSYDHAGGATNISWNISSGPYDSYQSIRVP